MLDATSLKARAQLPSWLPGGAACGDNGRKVGAWLHRVHLRLNAKLGSRSDRAKQERPNKVICETVFRRYEFQRRTPLL
jgi:hypothetical protein